MRKFTQVAALGCAAVMLMGAFAGCAKKADTNATSQNGQTQADTQTKEEQSAAPAELTKVTFALDWTPNTNHTGLYVARELGYFAEEGIDLEIIEALDEGAEAVVASNVAQFGVSFQDYLVPLFAVEDKVGVTAVASIISHNTSCIISPKELGITNAGQMAGHNYATWDLPIEQATLKTAVEKDGGDWNQVELISQYVENIQGAFESGINSVWIYYAWDGIKCEQLGLDTNIFFIKDFAEELDNYSPIIIANDSFLKANPNLTKGFMRAVSRGYEYAMENPEEAAKILVDANEGMDLELCTASQKWLVDQYQADAPKWGYIDQARWDAYYSWVYENGLCEIEIPAGYGFTNEFLPE